MPLLNVRNLSVQYDGIIAVKNASITVGEQESVMLIGANGSGKSSTLRALLGLVPSTSESMTLGSNDIKSLSTQARVREGLALVPETREVFPGMTVEDNLKLGLYLRKAESSFKDELGRISELFPLLKDRLKQRAGTLSGGEQQMLALGRALMQRPRLLCLDEPSLGLAPKLVENLYEMLVKVRKSGVSILLVEQQARRALSFGNRGYIMSVGEIIREASCQDLAQDDFVRSAYLGNRRL